MFDFAIKMMIQKALQIYTFFFNHKQTSNGFFY